MFCGILSLFSGHHFMMCSFSFCKWLSRAVSCCNSCIVIHSGMFVGVSQLLTFTCIPAISSSLSSLCFCLDSQSAMKRSWPGFYFMLTLYWCILRSIHCNLCNNVATSSLNIATSCLWSIIMLTSLPEQ